MFVRRFVFILNNSSSLRSSSVNNFRYYENCLKKDCLLPPKQMIITPMMRHLHSLQHNSSILFNHMPVCSVQPSKCYAKKKGNKGKVSVVDITLEEMSEVINASRMKNEFDGALGQLKDEYMKALAVRTNIGSIENLPVLMDGETFPLNEVAEVHRKSQQLVIINCAAFPQYTKNVLEAITKSGMNLNPQQEGTTLAVPLPKITREHRENLSSKAKVLCNNCKNNIRAIHNTYCKKASNKSETVSEDLVFRVIQKIREYQTNYIKEADNMLAVKQQELLK